MPNWWDTVQSNMGQMYAPNYGSLAPQDKQQASNQAFTQLGLGMLRNANERLPVAVGRAGAGMQAGGREAMRAKMAAELFNQRKEENKYKQEARERRREATNRILQSGNQEAIMRLNLGDIEGALETAFPDSITATQRAHGSVVPYQNADNSIGYGFGTKSGGFMDLKPPPGASFLSPYQRAADTARGRTIGKSAGEAAGTLPGARASAKQTIGKIDALLSDPNLGKITGVESYVPDVALAAVRGPAVLALRRRVEQLQGTAFLEAYNMLKGGGQITEVEGTKAENAMARLNTAQSDEEFVTALRDFKDAVAVGLQKIEAQAAQGQSSQRQPLQSRPTTQPDNDPLGLR